MLITLRKGVVDGLARALGRPVQPDGSWLARNPVGAWVGRSSTRLYNVDLLGFKVEKGETGGNLVALP